MNAKKAVVIGAGIGGLCSAIALLRQGWRVSVCDKDASLRETGAGIVLAANAMKALERLGVDEQVRSKGATVGTAEIRTWDGKLLVDLPAKKQAELYGTYGYVIHRAELQSILMDAVQAYAPIQTNKQCVNIEQTRHQAAADFADGTREEADVVIGADGIHSAVRERLFGPSRLRYSGYMAYRGVCHYEDESYTVEKGGGFEALGPGKRFGLSHLGQGRIFWFAAVNAPEGTLLPPAERKAAAMELFRGWYSPVVSAIAATDEISFLAHDIVDRRPLSRWSAGRVTLLGDAAHPMLPNLGQGGAQAMEDAIVLARCLSRSDVPDALSQYEKERLARTARIVRLSRSMGRIAQLENPLLIQIRNMAFAAMNESVYIRRFDPIVGYQVR